MKEKKVKIRLAENEASPIRWIVVLVLSVFLGSLVGSLVSEPIKNLSVFGEGGALNCISDMAALVAFIACFFVTVLLIRIIAKTSYKSFVLGRAHEKHTAETLILTGLYFVGMVLNVLMVIGNVSLSHAPIKTVLLTFAAALIVTWFQTTTEELWFRGIGARIFFKDDIRKPFCAKSVIATVVFSLLFMAMHLANPEVLTTFGLDTVFMALSYFIAGAMLMVVDFYLGSLEAGIAIHFLNNFINFTIISPEVSAGGSVTIFVDRTASNKGLISLLGIIVSYVPIVIYLIVKTSKSRKAAKSAK